MVDRNELDNLIRQGIINKTPDIEIFRDEIRELEHSGFVRRQNDEKNLMFQNSLTWEVVYETLLYAERRRLHYLIAMHIEKNNENNLPHVAGLLLHHYEKSNSYNECVYYGSMAGDRAAEMYANNDAVEFYQRALKSLTNVKKIFLVDESLVKEKIGDVYDSSGDDKKAEVSYLEALKIWRRTNNPTKPFLVPWKIKKSTRSSSLCQKIAVSCERQSNYDLSLEWLSKAIDVMPVRPGRVAAQVFASKSVALYRKGDYQEGIKWGKRALRVAKRLDIPSGLAYANNMLATSYIETGDILKAILYFKNAASIYEKNNNLPGIASANSNLGSCFGMLSDIDSAVKYFNIALDSDKRVHNDSNIAIDHQNLGNVYLIIGKYNDAIKHFKSAISSLIVCRSDLKGSVLIGLSQCYLGKGDIEKSEEHIDKAIVVLSEAGQNGLVVEAELQLAELRVSQQRSEEALSICTDTLKKIHDQNAVYYEVKAERVLGMAYKFINKIDLAIGHLDSSIKISHDIGMTYDEAKSILIRSELLLVNQLKDKNEVFVEIEYANNVFRKINAKSDYDEGCRLINQFK